MSLRTGFIRFAEPLDRAHFIAQVQAVTGLEHSFYKAQDDHIVLYSDVHDTQLGTIKSLVANYEAELIESFPYEPLV